jgi:arsenate reductase-like glutaredoxin family protein
MKRPTWKLIYNSKKETDKEVYGMLKVMHDNLIELDVQHSNLTYTQLIQLAKGLKVTVDGLFDVDSDQYHKRLTTISECAKLTILNADMTFLKTPIIVREDGVATFLSLPVELKHE